MSWQASKWAAQQSAGSMPAKAALLVLAEASDEEGYTFIGHDEIATRAEMGKRTVVEHVQQLEARGLIKRERRFNPADGSRTSNGIYLQLAQGAAPALGAAVQGAPAALGAVAKVQLTARLSAAERAPKCGSRTLTSQEPVNNRQMGEKPSRRKPEKPLPDGFPDQPAIERARLRFLSTGYNFDPIGQAEAFRNNALSHDKRFRDWGAAFNTWTANAIKWAKPADRLPVVAMPAAPATVDEQWRPRFRSLQASQFWNTTDWGPKPGKSGCLAPAGILAEFGYGDPNVVPITRGVTA